MNRVLPDEAQNRRRLFVWDDGWRVIVASLFYVAGVFAGIYVLVRFVKWAWQ